MCTYTNATTFITSKYHYIITYKLYIHTFSLIFISDHYVHNRVQFKIILLLY